MNDLLVIRNFIECEFQNSFRDNLAYPFAAQIVTVWSFRNQPKCHPVYGFDARPPAQNHLSSSRPIKRHSLSSGCSS